MLCSATLSDLDVVVSWIATARDCELWAGWRVTFPIDRQSLPAAIGFTDGNAFSLMDGKELVAFGQLVTKDHGRAHLARLIVRPAFRGKGHGQTLVRAMVEQAIAGPFERVSLNVDDSNVPAVSLYLKLGFVEATRPADEPAAAGSRYLELSLRPSSTSRLAPP
jgi:ribosomal protein S18 acetylase RimI-like enzyme